MNPKFYTLKFTVYGLPENSIISIPDTTGLRDHGGVLINPHHLARYGELYSGYINETETHPTGSGVLFLGSCASTSDGKLKFFHSDWLLSTRSSVLLRDMYGLSRGTTVEIMDTDDQLWEFSTERGKVHLNPHRYKHSNIAFDTFLKQFPVGIPAGCVYYGIHSGGKTNFFHSSWLDGTTPLPPLP